MKDINTALRSHRKPAKPEFYQLIVVVNFNRVISRLIENRLIVNVPKRHLVRTELRGDFMNSGSVLMMQVLIVP